MIAPASPIPEGFIAPDMASTIGPQEPAISAQPDMATIAQVT
ncbi:hypothetical protein [Rhizobium gallicum]|nr:hypothetical protein [Rhizobium gallicum]